MRLTCTASCGEPLQPSGHFTGLPAASYFAETMDANGCVSGIPFEITEPLPFLATLDSAVNVTCNSGADGAIYTTLTGGTVPYNISWTGPSGFTASTPDITGLAAGTYSVTLTDLNGCATYSFIEVITQPDAIVITGSTLSDFGGYGVQCPESADGSITVSASGGTPPLSYGWTGGGIYFDPGLHLLPQGWHIYSYHNRQQRVHSDKGLCAYRT
ncbi:MAG: SprB repeat-containing protein [Bacteroidales bacterium]|nr:SprB repeat-containing protein [Bacteroidales bacterium]